MDCEMCGKPATAKAMVEGTQMTVCDSCAKFGTNVKSLPSTVKPTKSTSFSHQPVKEELIETVRPDIAKLLRLHREKSGLTHEQFSAKLQIRASTYHHYESGTTTPDIATARKLEHELKMPLVVHIRVSTPTTTTQESRSMTMGDFFKKK